MRSRIFNWILLLLPPISPSNEPWEDEAPLPITRWHYHRAIVSLVLVASISGLLYWKVTALRYSIITTVAWLITEVSGSKRAGDIFSVLVTDVMLLLLVWMLTKEQGALPGAALREEKMFRVGAENWNWRQRQTSNVIFGAVHVLNLFVPLAAVIGLASGGWWFMLIYRRGFNESGSRIHAMRESAGVHAAHNKLVLAVFFPLMIVVVITYYVIKLV